MKPYVTCLGLCAVLVAGHGMAQTAEDQPAEPSEQAPSAADAADPAPPPEPAAAEDSENEDSPFDYQASEQISEDLSVSFPIDI